MSRFRDLKNFVLDLLFPPYCVNCDAEEGGWLCKKCSKDIIPVVSQVCPECEKLSPGGLYHEQCKEGKALKGIISASYFEEGPVREMIHNFKYNGVLELAKPLSDLMVDALKHKDQISIINDQLSRKSNKLKNLRPDTYLKIDTCNLIICFVPLHWRRQAQRGYNQSEVLARAIGAKLNIEVCEMLIKKKSTKRQAQLTGTNRRKNLSDVFILKPGIRIKNKTIIIVDDICTTGSTLNECGRVLRAAGAKEVWGLVVARG